MFVIDLRLLVSGHLQKEHEFFVNFVEGGRTVKEFCNQVNFSDASFHRFYRTNCVTHRRSLVHFGIHFVLIGGRAHGKGE